MSFETWIRLIVAGVFGSVGASNISLSFSKRWLAGRGLAFAKRNLAWVDASLVPQFDALTRRRARGLGVLALLIAAGVTFVPLPAGDDDAVTSILLAFVAASFLGGVAVHVWLLAGPALGGEPRVSVARNRAVSLTDYVWPWFRAAVLALGVLALGIAFAGLVVSRQRGVDVTHVLPSAGLALTFAVGVLVTDRAVAHIAGIREPGGDPAHLYWMDAYRAETIVRLYGTWVTGVFFLIMQSTTGISDALIEAHKTGQADGFQAWSLPVTFGIFAVGAAMSAVHSGPGKQWFRKRLWPTLAPGQLLHPGQTVPDQVGAPA